MSSALALSLADHHLERIPTARQSGSISAQKVRRQLSRILQSGVFIHAHRMKRFLGFIVEETLAGRAAQVCEYSIGISVFGRDETFEPGLDPIVRNDARRLRQKLVEYYQGSQSDTSDQLIIEVPKGGYVPVFRTAKNPRLTRAGQNYRLTVSLIRVADGAEVWFTEQELTLQ